MRANTPRVLALQYLFAFRAHLLRVIVQSRGPRHFKQLTELLWSLKTPPHIYNATRCLPCLQGVDV